jgi:hypothetical protein
MNRSKDKERFDGFVFPGDGGAGASALLQFFKAGFAHQFPFVQDDITRIITKDTSRMIFLEDDLITVNENLQCVFDGNVHSPAQLDGNDNSTQFV